MQRNESGTFRFGAYFEGELPDSAEDLASMLHDLGWLVAVHAIRYHDRLAEAGAVASIGSVGDSYGCEHPAVTAAAV